MSESLLASDPLGVGRPPGKNALDWLRARAVDQRFDPWLFFSQGIRWRWRSFEQVADHVARVRSSIESAVSASGPTDGVAFRGRRGPDSVAISLAIQAAGETAMAVLPGQPLASLASGSALPWVQTEETPRDQPDTAQARFEVPAARSDLEAWTAEPLEAGGGWIAATAGNERVSRFSSEEIAAAAVALDGTISPFLREVEIPPVVLLGPSADPWQAEIFLTWTLSRGFPVVLEPDSDAVAATALWARPHLVLASSSELERLAQLLGQRSHLKNHRLSLLVATDEDAPSPLARLRWESMGVPLCRWVTAKARWRGPASRPG